MTLESFEPSDDLGWPKQQPRLGSGGVVLRAWELRDVDAVFEACQDDEIQRWTTVPSPYLLEHAVDFVGGFASQKWRDRDGAPFCVAAADSDRVLGACGLVTVDPTARVGEVGYWIAPVERGAGVARIAVQLLAEWALGEGGLERLELFIEPDNVGSMSVAESVGCVRESAVRQHEFGGNDVRDVAVFVLTEAFG